VSEQGLPSSVQMDMVASDAHLTQFNKLVAELLKGTLTRNTFRPWEIEILLDIEGCSLREGAKRETLRRYQKAVQRQMEKGAAYPMRLSEYLENPRRTKGTGVETEVEMEEEVKVA
jgi:hypothetical protein